MTAAQSGTEDAWGKLLKPPHVVRYVSIFLALQVAAFLLGIAFFIIFVGAAFGFRRLALFWEPATRLMAIITGIPDLHPIRRTRRQWSLFIGDAIRGAFALALIYLGTRTLLAAGFCGQSLFC